MRADDYPQTAESIAHAKAAAAQERAAITAATGIRIDAEGQIIRPPRSRIQSTEKGSK